MRQILLLVRKDLLRRLRSPLGVLVMLAFPLLFAGMLAMVFGGDDDSISRARLLLEDRDGGLGGSFIKSFLGAEQMRDFLELVEVDEGTGLARIEDGEAAALLILPPGTTEALVDGETIRFELIRNPAQSILPEIAEQVSEILAEVLSIGSSIFGEELSQLRETVSGFDGLESFDDLADEDFTRLALSLRRVFETAGRYVSEPPLKIESVTLGEDPPDEEKADEEGADEASQSVAIFLFILPGIAVYSLFVIGDQMMRDVLVESRLGTLKRQLTTPITTQRVLFAKVLATLVVASVALLFLAAVTAFVATKPVSAPAFVALSLALVLAVTGLASFIYGLSSDERRGSTVASVIYLVMAFSGGSFLPLDNLPAALRAVAPASPFYWGTRGFQDLLLMESGLGDLLQPILILAGLGVVLLFIGARLLERRVLRGGAA